MPRLSAAKTVPSAPVARRQARARKPAAPKDRLTARRFFLRRVKRSLKPGLLLFGIVGALALLWQIVHSIPGLQKSADTQATGLWRGLAGIAGDAGLRVSHLQIIGADTTPASIIENAMGVQMGEPILALSLPALQARVEQLGAVQSAIVERAWPGTLIVNITERSAYAVWQTDQAGTAKFVLIDKAGNVIAGQDAVAAKRRDPGLLLLVGADAPANARTLMNELTAVPLLKDRVVAASRVDGLRWNLTLKDHTLVKLPVADEQHAMTQLALLQGSMALLDRPVEVIDLRLPGRLVVRPYAAAPTANMGDHL